MKPLAAFALGAVVAVGVLVYFMLDPDRDRAGGRTAHEAAEEPGDAGTASGKDPSAAGYAVTVMVEMPDGAAAAGATVELRGAAGRSARTGRDGSARFDGLPGGDYDLVARKDRNAGALDFELLGDRDLGRLRLRAAVAVRGHVFDAAGDPVGKALVEAVRNDPSNVMDSMAAWSRSLRPDAVAAFTSSAPDGSYELLLPGPGPYLLRVTADGFGVASEPTRPFESDVEGLDFHLLPGSFIEGRDVDPSEKPVACARVLAVGGMRATFAKSVSTTAADGSFRLPVAAGNQLTLRVTAAGFAPHSELRLQPPVKGLVVTLERGVELRLRAVDGPGGAPIEGIAVLVRYANDLREAETDPLGEVRFERMPTGEGPGRGQAFLAGRGYVPEIVDLSALEPVDDVLDAGDVEMQVGGVVSGRVLEKESAQPVAGADVRWFSRSRAQAMTLEAVRTVSGPDGRYELTGVALDATAILASREGFVSDTDIRELFRNATPLFEEHGPTRLERDVLLVPEKSITGIVLSPDGSPVAGARVATRATRPSFLQSGAGDAITDALGAFTIGGLRDREPVSLHATHRAYGDSETVGAMAGRGEPVTLHLAPPLRVVGTVVDSDAAPVASVQVSVTPKGSRPRPFGLDDPGGVTDREGRFVVRNAPSGEVDVTFVHPGYLAARRSIATRGGEHDMGEILLERGPVVAGVVVDGADAPVAGAGVQLMWQRGDSTPMVANMDPTQGRTWATARTDEAGEFAFHGLREGSYRIQVQKHGWFGDRPVVPAGTLDARIVLKPAATLRGRVLGGGAPVAQAFVRAELTAPGARNAWLAGTRTGEDGAFVLTGLPPEDGFGITISHQAFRELKLTGIRATSSRQDFTLERGAGFAGVLVERDGSPVPNASIAVLQDGKNAKWARTDGEGRFDVSGLGQGAVEVEVQWTPIGHIRTGRIPVKLGDMAIRIVVERGESIAGRAIWSDAEQQTGLRLEAIDREGRSVARAWAWSGNPGFKLEGLPKGTYTVRLSRNVPGQGMTVLVEIPEVPSGTADLKIEVPG